MTPTQGQLIYTSTDADGIGGWQIKQVSGQLPPPLVAELVARIPTTLELINAPSPFPTPAEIAAMPRRLLFAPIAAPHDTSGWWHSAPAGADASGRSGNVFTHCLVGATPQRPIELWRSPGWLTPYGVAQVAAAELGEAPAPGEISAAGAAVLFEASDWQVGTLCVLADAVVASLAGGPVVVLLVDHPDHGAAWLMALSMCLSSAGAARIGFSTFERASAARSWRTSGVQVVCAPSADADELASNREVVLIDPAQPPTIGFGAEPHRTHRGDPVAVSALSSLIMEQVLDAASFVQTAAEVVRVGQQAGDQGADLAWPLAMVAGLAGSNSPDVARVLGRSAPTGVAEVPELFAAASAAVTGQLGHDPAQHWQVWHDTAVPELAKLVGAGYLGAAAGDLEWLSQPGQTRTRDLPIPLTAAAGEEVVRGITALIGWSDPRRALAAVHLVDMICGAGWQEALGLEGPVRRLTEEVVIEAVCQRGDLADFLQGGLLASTQRYLRRILLDTDVRGLVPSGGIPAGNLALVGLADPAVLEIAQVVTDEAGDLRPIAIEIAQAALRAPADHRGRGLDRARGIVIQAELQAGRPVPGELLADPLPPRQLADWLIDGRVLVPAQLIEVTLLASPDGPELQGLAAAVMRNSRDPVVRLAAAIRQTSGQKLFTSEQVDYLGAKRESNWQIDAEVLGAVQPQVLAAIVRGREVNDRWVAYFAAHPQRTSRAAVEQLAKLLWCEFPNSDDLLRKFLRLQPGASGDDPHGFRRWTRNWAVLGASPRRLVIDVFFWEVMALYTRQYGQIELRGIDRAGERVIRRWWMDNELQAKLGGPAGRRKDQS